MTQSWPLSVHAMLAAWVCYVAMLFYIAPEFTDRLIGHVLILGAPPWVLGRAMMGAYNKKPEAP